MYSFIHSPADIIPLPRAGQQRVSKKGKKRRHETSCEHAGSQQYRREACSKETQKRESATQSQKTLFRSGFRRKSPSSSVESDGSMVFAENGDTNISDDEELIEGDFVIVKLV